MSDSKGTINDYINSSPEEIKETLRTVQKVIREEIPDAEETISYGIPTFKLNGSYVVYFAGYKKHISIYPISEEIIKSLPDDSSYKLSGQGTIQFPIDKPLPISLIRKVVKGLLRENLKRHSKK